eukprot:UN05375
MDEIKRGNVRVWWQCDMCEIGCNVCVLYCVCVLWQCTCLVAMWQFVTMYVFGGNVAICGNDAM